MSWDFHEYYHGKPGNVKGFYFKSPDHPEIVVDVNSVVCIFSKYP